MPPLKTPSTSTTGHTINGQNFNREFAVRLYVPDIKNYLFVQKIAEDGYTPLSGAGFALYKASDVTDGAVNPGAQPFDTVTTRNQSQNQGDVITLGGAGVFPNTQAVLPAGTYYLKELQAPAGYAPVTTSPKSLWTTPMSMPMPAPPTMTSRCCGVWDTRSRVAVCGARRHQRHPHRHPGRSVHGALLHAGAPATTGAVWTASGQTPLALSYYQNNQILEYGPTTPRGPRLFCRAVRLVPLRITQNYAAGTDQALKINLGDQNVSNVFARSTIVQVRNQSTRLVLQKQVTGALGEVTRPFAFTIALQDAAGTPPDRQLRRPDLQRPRARAETALTDGGEITLRGLPDGTVCTVYEEPVPDYETTVRVNGGTAQPGPSVQVTTDPGADHHPLHQPQHAGAPLPHAGTFRDALPRSVRMPPGHGHACRHHPPR